MRKILTLVTALLLMVSSVNAQQQILGRGDLNQLQVQLTEAEKAGNNRMALTTLYNMGLTYYNKQDAVKAIKYLKQAIAKSTVEEEEEDPFLIAQLYAHAGHVSLMLGNQNEAQQYLVKAQSLKPTMPAVQELSKMMGNRNLSSDYSQEINRPVVRWNDRTSVIVVYIAPESPERVEAVQKAFQTWQEATDDRFQFRFVNNAEEADVELNWNHEALHVNNAEMGGVFQPEFTGEHFYRSDIKLALQDPKGNLIPNEHIYSKTLHEIGHMLGLPHSPNVGDVMHPNGAALQISSRDLATLQALYKRKPDFTNKPGLTVGQFRRQLGSNGYW